MNDKQNMSNENFQNLYKSLEENIKKLYIKENEKFNEILMQEKVREYNEPLMNYLNLVDNYYKDITLKTFNPEEYYTSLKKTLNFKEYIPLNKPDKEKIREEIGCFEENKFLETFLKIRKNNRIKKENEFQNRWKIEYEKYLENEENNKLKYEKEKDIVVNEIEEYNNMIEQRYKNFKSRNSEEIEKILLDNMSSPSGFNERKSILVKETDIMACNDIENWIIDIQLENPKEFILNFKLYQYNKSKKEIETEKYSKEELENLFKKVVFSSNVYFAYKLLYFFKGIINKLLVNSYVKDINNITGREEKVCIMSYLIDVNDIVLGNINNIDCFEFVNSLYPRYNNPLIDIKSIIPYTFSDNIKDIIKSNMDDFNFENMVIPLLEKNGFTDVTFRKKSIYYGKSLTAKKDGMTYVIQCIKSSFKISIGLVRQVKYKMEEYQCDKGIFLTNSDFTLPAIKLAKSVNIILWDGEVLNEMIEKMLKD